VWKHTSQTVVGELRVEPREMAFQRGEPEIIVVQATAVALTFDTRILHQQVFRRNREILTARRRMFRQ
jgi:hypothetical protein